MNSIAIEPAARSRHRPRRRVALRDLLRRNPHISPFADGWYVVTFAKKARVGRPFARQFLGENVLIHRDPATRAAIVERACGPGAEPFRYRTVEHNGFILALHQRDPGAPPLPLELEFPGVDPAAMARANQTLGVFDGDPVVPLMANADYHHFHSVHGRNLLRSNHQFSISPDGRECRFGFEIDDTLTGQGDPEYPRSGFLKPLRKMLARPSILHPAGGMTWVDSIGRGPGIVISRWTQPAFSTDLVTWLYVTPLNAHQFEVYLCHGANTLKRFKSPWMQKAVNAFSANAFMLSMFLFVGQEDPPFYSNRKIRLDKPAFNRYDGNLHQYLAWWRGLFPTDFQAMIAGWDIDFT